MSKKSFPQSPLRFIAFFLRPYRWLFSGMMVIAFIWALDVSLRPYLVKIMVDVLEKTPPSSPDLLYILKYPALAYVFLALFMNLMNRSYDYLSLKVMPNLNKNIVLSLTKYIQKHSHTYFQNHFGGSIVSKISIAADTAENILDTSIHHFLTPLITLCVASVTMAMVYPPLALILFIWALLFVWISYRLSRYVHVLSQELSERHTSFIGRLIDSITNVLAVRLFARTKYEAKLLKISAQEKAAKAQELRWNDLKRQAVMETMANLLIGILLFNLIIGRQRGVISIGDFALILSLSISIIDIIWNISRNYIRFVEDLGKCSQALTIIISPHEIEDKPNAVPLKIKGGAIEFKNVTLNYQKGKPFFDNLSVKIKGGEKVGIVGYSGSGKTTFVNLIVRLFDTTSGAILIDGQDIKGVTQDSLHQNISFIPQDPMLFHRTIIKNLKYGKLDASEDEIMTASKRAHAHEFIKDLPQGYQTMVGERGAKLSGGQRQRLAIARAILKNSKILILDEATSALDSVTEHYIQESLDNLMQDKTVLVIAHRLSTLHKMDRLLVFDKGKIVEEGTHASLLKKKDGLYAKLWDMQVNGFLPQNVEA